MVQQYKPEILYGPSRLRNRKFSFLTTLLLNSIGTSRLLGRMLFPVVQNSRRLTSSFTVTELPMVSTCLLFAPVFIRRNDTLCRFSYFCLACIGANKFSLRWWQIEKGLMLTYTTDSFSSLSFSLQLFIPWLSASGKPTEWLQFFKAGHSIRLNCNSNTHFREIGYNYYTVALLILLENSVTAFRASFRNHSWWQRNTCVLTSTGCPFLATSKKFWTASSADSLMVGTI